MKNTIKTLKRIAAAFALIAVLCGFSITAQATLIETHEGLELTAAMITLPSSENGSLTVKQCDECDRLKLKTSTDITNFIIRDESGNSETVSLAGFAKEMRLIDNRDAMVMVFYRIDTQSVTEARLMSQKPVARGRPQQEKSQTRKPGR